MTSAIQHRGPHDAGFYTDSHAFLGHRRLSIIDLSGGHQPMSNQDGSSLEQEVLLEYFLSGM
jgi:asparagine synthase (glutamine-hydrolysing)